MIKSMLGMSQKQNLEAISDGNYGSLDRCARPLVINNGRRELWR